MAELGYALVLGTSGRKSVEVRSLSGAPFMVKVAERIMRKFVVLVYAGSNPVPHPFLRQ